MFFRRFLLAFATLTICSSAFAQDHVPGQLIVQFQPGWDGGAYAVLNRAVMTPVKPLSHSMRIWLMTHHLHMDDDKALEIVKNDPAVSEAQFNHYVELRDSTPDDPSFSQQWGHHNIGQTGGMPGADIGAVLAWDSVTGGLTPLGDTIVVAIIDGGFDLAHEDLDYFKNYDEIPGNGIDDDANGYVDDFDGWNAYNSDGNVNTITANHGTHVAGISGAIGNNGVGVSGVNWHVKVMPISGSSSLESTVVEAYSYCLDMRRLYDFTFGAKGAYVVATNSSFGVNFGQPANFPIWCAMYDSLGKYGILSCGATANLNIDIDVDNDIPTGCASHFLLSITNTNDADLRNAGAAFGLTTVDLGAPGTSILSTTPGNNYGNSTGTSMATPQVTGAIGLMYSAASGDLMGFGSTYPDSLALLIKQAIMAGVDPNASLQGITVTGGRLNLFGAVRELDNLSFGDCDVDFNVNIKNVTCHGDADGFIDLILLSNPAGLTYTWSTGETTEDILNLSGGAYTILIRDSSGCSEARSVFVEEPAELLFSFLAQTPENGAVPGTITATGSGGSSGLLFSLDGVNFQTNGFFPGLPAGTYTVSMRDSSGCSRDSSITVENITGIDEPRDATLRVFPNPVDGLVQVEVGLAGDHRLTLHLFNKLGQAVLEQNVTRQSGMYRTMVDLSGLASGLYHMSLSQGTQTIAVTKLSKF